MNTIIQLMADDPDFKSIAQGFEKGMKEQMISGLSGSSRQMFIAALSEKLDRPIMVVTHNMFSAQKIAEDLQACLCREKVLMYPANELIAAEAAISSPETLAQRMDVLVSLAKGFRGLIVVPFSGIRRYLPTKQAILDSEVSIKVGSEIEVNEFLMKLVDLGYSRVDRVETKGEYSVRGGIVDVFPLTSSLALRVEWFGDEVDSIRTFDTTDQRTVERVDEVVVTPAHEFFASRERMHTAARHATNLLQGQLDKMTDRHAKERLDEEIKSEIEKLREGIYFHEAYKYIELLYPEKQTLLDYMPADTVMVLEEPSRLIETAKQLEKDELEWGLHLLQHGKSIPGLVLAKATNEIILRRPFPTLFMQLFLRQIPHSQPQNIVNVTTKQMQSFHGQMNVLKTEMERWKKSGHHVYILADNKERMDRVRRVLDDYDIPVPIIVQGNLQTGFELSSAKLVLITEGEMFTQKQRKAAKRVDKKLDNAERIKSYTELKVGDYVVHQGHGIGKYVGIGTLQIGGINRDYLHIVYAGGDKLSVPVDQVDLIQKYVGSEEKEPKVNKLGGTEWAKAKSKARSSVKDIADDLIKLYADRQATVGYGFSQDTSYQQDFEAMFPYEETTDQLRAIKEIKQDMELPRPMDRLLCGDVGYGKTEVAVRAAFKAAMDSKQVAILVPTTILAQQHYETFKERFSGYPINVSVMSRFRTRKEQNETIKGLKNGTIDVVIGTHRVLSQDIVFNSLGLVIVDEEQRFGVQHKERLKQLKTSVDVLTLTATPIPRTLHMSMLGVRDLSVIETPPENRFPVQTYVLEYSANLVREAIERELARGGQVYYLYNRVQGIYQIADEISELVPNARVSVGHGRMSEQELEKTILDFLEGESDVLVSTSIIETGVDIPNTNTLIVHDADKMGLSQLYQLRGRVGRSNRIAYAYFTYQRDKVLTEVAEKRLQSIKEFTELGSGFKIAMRDLAIRGAGNLLGAEQSGFIASVGFEMFSQMLSDEIKVRKQLMEGVVEEVKPPIQTFIDVNINAYLPSEYIYDSMQKIEIYRKTATVSTLDEAYELVDELVDRFGDLPEPVDNLMRVSRVKVMGSILRIAQIAMVKDDFVIKFEEHPKRKEIRSEVDKLALKYENRFRQAKEQEANYKIELRGKGLSVEQKLHLTEKFLADYVAIVERINQPKAVSN